MRLSELFMLRLSMSGKCSKTRLARLARAFFRVSAACPPGIDGIVDAARLTLN
jgi:hypothetical protein